VGSDHHDYETCGDPNCDRYPCVVYKAGYAAGLDDGYQDGYADGFCDGAASAEGS
jgi:hypothetical protein